MAPADTNGQDRKGARDERLLTRRIVARLTLDLRRHYRDPVIFGKGLGALIIQFSLPIAFVIFLASGYAEAGAGNIRQVPESPTQAVALNEADTSRSDSLLPDQKSPEGGFSITSGKQLCLSGYTQLELGIFQPAAGKNSGASLRRIRFSLSGELTKQWQYLFQADFASSPKALDAYVRFSPFTFFNMAAGQFKIPFSRESLNSSSNLQFIDRPQVVEALCARSTDVLGNQYGRDIGIQLGGSITGQERTRLLDYAAGVFDGSGINSSDNNSAKDFCGRVILHPLAGLDVGGSCNNGYDKWGSPASNQRRTRLGLEFGYVYQSVDLAGEYIAGYDGPIKRDGWYVQTGWFLIRKVLQVAARYDAFDDNVSLEGMTTVNYVLGVNCFFTPTVKLQANYIMVREENAQKNNDVVEMQLQFGF